MSEQKHSIEANEEIIRLQNKIEELEKIYNKINELHAPNWHDNSSKNPIWCRACDQDWPCETHIVLKEKTIDEKTIEYLYVIYFDDEIEKRTGFGWVVALPKDIPIESFATKQECIVWCEIHDVNYAWKKRSDIYNN